MDNPPSRTPFGCHTIHAHDDELAAFGIQLEHPHGSIVYRLRDSGLMAEFGQLIVEGDTIHAIPKHGVDITQYGQLIGAAFDAWETPPTAAGGWHQSTVDGRHRWTTYLSGHADSISVATLTATQATPHPQTEANARAA